MFELADTSPTLPIPRLEQVEGGTTVILAYQERLDHPYASALLVRRAGRDGDVILIVSDRTSVGALQRSFLLLAQSLRKHGRHLTREVRAYVPDTTREGVSVDGEAEALERARTGEVKSLGDLGQLPGITITVDHRGRMLRGG
jgi:hypothetical protein